MNKRSGNFRTILIYIIVVGVLIFTLSSLFTGTGDKDPGYSDIVSHFQKQEVKEFFVDNEGIIRLTLQDDSKVNYRLASISFFREDEGKLRVGFCVLGGSFSEGMDLPGSRLIGTVVVGVGLPGLSAERNIIRDYYETKSECGYDYAYTYTYSYSSGTRKAC